MRKDKRDRKDIRGTKNTNYNSCFFILLLVKSRLGIFPQINNFFTLFINTKTIDKTKYIYLKKGLISI